MSRKPNVVFVLTDDQGYPPLGCHGHPFIKTPNLDQFYQKSTHLNQFHVGPTCAPTRAGLLTGHYANSTGVWHTIGGRSLLRKDEWTLADALKQGGYRTGIFGKWHLGDESPYLPQERGFETTVCHGGGGISQTPDYWGNDYFDDTYSVNGTPQAFKGYCTDVFFREALRYIEENKDQPFFCYIATNAPHGPYNVDSKYSNLYKNHTDSDAYARFLGMITNIDENFGLLMAKLDELKLTDDTILIFMSDNGQCGGAAGSVKDAFNSGMRGYKGSEYDGGHRVPCFISYPNGQLKENYDVNDITAFVDFMPTVLDLCNVAVPENRTFHGTSVVPLMKGETGGSWKERCIVTDSQRLVNPVKWKQSCVMKDTLRLVDRDELYDLATDPMQQRDISAEHPQLVSELRDAYEEWWKLVSTQFDEDIPISLGVPGRKECKLTSHDIRSEYVDNAAWNQGHIRKGHVCNGYWEILVEQTGKYEIELRRWPKEAGHKIRDGIEGTDIEFEREFVQDWSNSLYTGGVALDINTACLKITNCEMLSCPVEKDDTGAKFIMDLNKGPAHLRAWFTNNRNRYMSAYYVYIKLLD